MAFNSDGARGRAGRLALVLGIGVAALLFSLNRMGPAQDGSFRAGVEDKVAPVTSVVSMPFRGIEKALSNRRARGQAFAENIELKDELRRLQDVERRAAELERKLDAMRTHTELPPVENHTLVLARAVSETRGPFAQAALVNAGSREGVRVGSAVMSPSGLYGHVLRVGERSSRVLRLTDPNSRIAVRSARSDGRAILAGSFEGAPVLSYLNNETQFQPGDEVLTSGDEGVLPSGLTVGIVGEANRVALAEDGRNADWVRIHVREPIPVPGDTGERTVMRIVRVPVEPEDETESDEAGAGGPNAGGPSSDGGSGGGSGGGGGL